MFDKAIKHKLLSGICGIGLVIMIIALLSCQAIKPVGAQMEISPTKGRERPDIRIAELEKYIHDLINRERGKNGLSSLAFNKSLKEIARRHSEDMAGRNYFSHYSPEGHGFSDRYKQAGYVCKIPGKGMSYLAGAENIYQNNLYNRVKIVNGIKYYDWNLPETIAETTVEGWMNSPEHRKNILMPHWQREGIGVAISSDGKIYITQNFC
ncbi:MAG: CAP domain-containing protein [Proteobacteria bacterium]|nr:CAP domain-containing protein [Pseudomonadota bacterium]MBU1713748.1 CAP domain-containing protein [Pseudomonadota bacterium]